MLKQLIQKLLDSRTTPEEAGHSAMPSTTKTIFLSKDETVGSWGILNAGIAPDDGYLFVNASAEDNTNSEVRAQLGNIFHVSAQAPAPKGLGIAIPVSKGASYSVEGAFVSHITVGFVKVIGGGYKRLIWRALSCLKPSFNYLPKVSLRAKRSGYLSGQSNCLTPRQSLKYQRQTHGRPSQCRLTVGLLSKGLTISRRRLTASLLVQDIKCSAFASVVSPIALHQFLFLVRRATLSVLPFTRANKTSPLEHLKPSLLANLQTGGALC